MIMKRSHKFLNIYIFLNMDLILQENTKIMENQSGNSKDFDFEISE